VRRSLIEEASRQFTERGYAATTMKDLSVATGTAISVLYHHFPSKAELLREAVLLPFMDVVDDIGASWTALQDQPWEDAKLIRVFLADLYHRLFESRGALLALVSAQSELDDAMRAEIHRALRRMFLEIRLITEDSKRRGWHPAENIDNQIRMMVTFIAGVAFFGDVFMPSDSDSDAVTEDRFDEMTEFVRFGISGRRPRTPRPAGSATADAQA
jgi:AcrR family transcriptional regulator